MMQVNIYYGGRGLIEDPTIYVINKLTEVLKELRVEVTRYNLYEEKHSMSALTRTLKECDGVVLAATVEWMGIGGLLQQFLDDCWLYADKEHLGSVYMLPVVTSMTYGEKDAEYSLIKAWDMLGGISCRGISAYVENHVEFETNPEYGFLIEKEAESLYRAISQKRASFPCSSNAVKKNVLRKNTLDLTPQESEQLSVYASNDSYVKKQKEDIEELAQLFKEMLGDTEGKSDEKTEKSEQTEQTEKIGKTGKIEKAGKTEQIEQTGKIKEQKKPPRENPQVRAEAGRESKTAEAAIRREYENGFTELLPQREEQADKAEKDRMVSRLHSRFRKGLGIAASFYFIFTDGGKNLVVEVQEDALHCYYGKKEDAQVIAKTTTAVFESLLAGDLSMQKAFMTGVLTAKGNFKTLRSFDSLFALN